MKNFQDILNLTEEQIDLENQKNSTIKNIVETLQLAESYLGRKMTKSEVHLFSDFLIEEEEKQQSAVLKKDNYTVEVSTPDGKVKRKATSQKGILDVIHGERNFRILDSNNRDITAKVKSLIKQRQKEEELKKKALAEGLIWADDDLDGLDKLEDVIREHGTAQDIEVN